MTASPLAVYIHWPFCKSKCQYCDFNSHVREQVEQGRWKAALLRELRTMASHVPDHRVTSIFFGGGTPSLMPPDTVAALGKASMWSSGGGHSAGPHTLDGTARPSRLPPPDQPARCLT